MMGLYSNKARYCCDGRCCYWKITLLEVVIKEWHRYNQFNCSNILCWPSSFSAAGEGA